MIIEISSLVLSSIVGMGVIVTWVKNGKSQSKRDQSLLSSQEEVIKRLDHPETGLTGINTRLQRFEVHCAKTSSTLIERVKSVESDIVNIKDKKRK